MHIADAIDYLKDEVGYSLQEKHHVYRTRSDGRRPTLSQLREAIYNLPSFMKLNSAYKVHISLARECMRVIQECKLRDLAYVEQDVAIGCDYNGNAIKNGLLEQELVEFLGNANIEQELLKCMSDEDKRAALNMNLLNRAKDPPRSERVHYEWNKQEHEQPKYRTSRFVPAIKD
ncbi:syntaxin binding protein 1, partial [Spiromyces aspiralis]